MGDLEYFLQRINNHVKLSQAQEFRDFLIEKTLNPNQQNHNYN